MSELSETIVANLSLGSRDGVVVYAGAGIKDHDTLTTGLSAIDHVSMTNSASGETGGYAVSGGVITFHLSGSWGIGATILAIGFK